MTAVARAVRPFRSLGSGWWWLRARPSLSAPAMVEAYRERVGGHEVCEEHEPHLDAAIAWLMAAQDATPDDGVSRGYSLVWHPEFRARGWQPSYPETTGYIIPTLYTLARVLGRADLAERATRSARWEVDVQLPSGAVQAGVLGVAPSPAVFNTGQVMLGWLAAWRETGEGVFAEALCRAGRCLIAMMAPDGHWPENSRFSRDDSTLYNTRTAWALAEAGQALGEPRFLEAAAWNLWAVVRMQRVNGWIPNCCLSDPDRPLLHTIAYAVRGLLEGGRVLEDEPLVRHAILAAEPLSGLVRDDGWMPGRISSNWAPAVSWSCLTGEAQMANVWLRLFRLTGDAKWLEPVPRVLRFIKNTQNRSSSDAGVHGGIRGSSPIGAPYGRYEVLSWATKFFADALLRDQAYRSKGSSLGTVEPLA